MGWFGKNKHVDFHNLSSKSANSDFPFTLYVLARHYTTGGTRPPFFPLRWIRSIRGWCTFSRLRLTGEFCLRIRIRWRSMVRCTFSRVLIFAGTPAFEWQIRIRKVHDTKYPRRENSSLQQCTTWQIPDATYRRCVSFATRNVTDAKTPRKNFPRKVSYSWSFTSCRVVNRRLLLQRVSCLYELPWP